MQSNAKCILHVFTLSACQLHQARQGWHSDMLLHIVGTVVLQPLCPFFQHDACNSFLKPVQKIKQLAVCMIVSEQGRTQAGPQKQSMAHTVSGLPLFLLKT